MRKEEKMNYNWNEPLLPGTIVCAKYNKFDGTLADGIFCVLYDEQLDNNVSTRKNALCVKLSTQLTLVSNYIVDVDMTRNTFLTAATMVCCSKVHVLHKEQQIYKILGKLDPITYLRVYKNYMKFNSELVRQMTTKL